MLLTIPFLYEFPTTGVVTRTLKPTGTHLKHLSLIPAIVGPNVYKLPINGTTF